MNDAAVSKPGAYTHVRVREPAGERSLGTTVTIGGEPLVAGALKPPNLPRRMMSSSPAQRRACCSPSSGRGADWFATPPLRLPALRCYSTAASSRPPRELHKDDVLSIGDAQIIVLDDSRTRLRLDVQHLVGNQTIPPVVTVTAVDVDTARRRRRDPPHPFRIRSAPRRRRAHRGAHQRQSPRLASRSLARRPSRSAAVLALLALITLLLSMLQTVEVDVRPDRCEHQHARHALLLPQRRLTSHARRLARRARRA